MPHSPEAAADRRDEPIGNVSLFRQRPSLAWANDIPSRDGPRPEFLAGPGVTEPLRMPPSAPDEAPRPRHIPMIRTSSALQAALVYSSRLDRSPASIRALMEEGAIEAVAFRAAREP